jgi:hypothetical protein
MTELRQLLEIGAGAPPAAPDLAAVKTRGRAMNRRRHVLAAAAIAAAVAVPTAALPSLVPDRPGPSWSTLPPAEPGALLPGRYTAARLTPKITFDVPDSATSWRVALATASSLVVTDDRDGIRISVLHWTAVRPAPSAAAPKPAPAALPTDLPAWLAGHSGIRLTRPVQRVQVLGRPAQRVTFDVRADRWLPAGPPEGCSCRTVTLADTPDNPFVVGADQTAQVTVMDGEQPGLVVALVRPARGTDPDAMADADRIVNSITVI